MSESPFKLEENIIHQLGLEALPEAERRALLDEMADLVQKRVLVRLVEGLSEEDSAKVGSLSEKPEAVIEFLAARHGDLGEIIEAEIRGLRAQLVDAAQGI